MVKRFFLNVNISNRLFFFEGCIYLIIFFQKEQPIPYLLSKTLHEKKEVFFQRTCARYNISYFQFYYIFSREITGLHMEQK